MKGWNVCMKKKLKDWIKAAGVRAIKTVAQTAVATKGEARLRQKPPAPGGADTGKRRKQG